MAAGMAEAFLQELPLESLLERSVVQCGEDSAWSRQEAGKVKESQSCRSTDSVRCLDVG